MTFILNSSKLSGNEETVTRQRLEGYARWVQFKVTSSSTNPHRLLGMLVYVYPGGERRLGS